MKKTALLTSVLIFLLVSSSSLADPCKCVDDHTLAKETLEEAEKAQGDCTGLGFCYFRDRESDQAVAVQIGCGCLMGKPFAVVYFHEGDVPESMVRDMKLYLRFHKTDKTTEDYTRDRIADAPEIEPKHFATRKGAKLGMSPEEIKKIYGEPHSSEDAGGEPKKTVYKWEVHPKSAEAAPEGGKPRVICGDLDARYTLSVTFVDGKAVLIEVGYHEV